MQQAYANVIIDEAVARDLSDWIERYVGYVAHMDHVSALESYNEHREIWQSVPELVIFMVNRK